VKICCRKLHIHSAFIMLTNVPTKILTRSLTAAYNHLRSWHEDISGHFGNRDANGQDINGKDPVPSICKTDKVTLPWRTLDFVTDNVDWRSLDVVVCSLTMGGSQVNEKKCEFHKCGRSCPGRRHSYHQSLASRSYSCHYVKSTARWESSFAREK